MRKQRKRSWLPVMPLVLFAGLPLAGNAQAQEDGTPPLRLPAQPPTPFFTVPGTPQPETAAKTFGKEFGDDILPEGGEFDPLGYSPQLQLGQPARPPEWPPPTGETSAPPEQPSGPLGGLARRVASSVVLLRAYDRYGIEVGRTVGFFVSRDGLVATDFSLLEPRSGAQAAYVTLVDAEAMARFVSGAVYFDRATGVLFLQTDATDVEPLVPAEGVGAALKDDDTMQVGIVAVNEQKGLLLADGRCERDDSTLRDSWWRIVGEDSPGAPGSPVLDMDGRLVGMIGLQLKLDQWVNYAVPLDGVMLRLAKAEGEPRAVNTWRIGRDRTPENDERFAEAWRLLYAGSHRQAASALRRLTRDYPRSAAVWALLGFSCKQGGEDGQALNAFRRAAALDPTLGMAWYGVAMSSVPGGDPASMASAEQALERTVAAQPDSEFAWRLLARCRLASGRYGPAADAAKQALSLSGTQDATLQFQLAVALAKMNDLEGARVAARRSVEIDRRNAEANFVLGMIEDRAGKPEAAIDAYKRCTAINPRHKTAWMNLAQLYLRLGRRTEARLAAQQHARGGG